MQHNEPPVIKIRCIVLDDTKRGKFPKEPLSDGDNSMHYERVEGLLRAGKTAKLLRIGIPAVKGLIKAFENPELKAAASETLGRIVAQHPKSDWEFSVEFFLKASEDADKRMRENAIACALRIALAHPDYDWSGAIPLLMLAFGMEAPIDFDAAGLFRRISEAHPEYDLGKAVFHLAMMVEKRHYGWEDAIVAMGNIGDVSAVPALEKVSGYSWNVQKAAAEALGKIVERHPEYDWGRTARALISFGSFDEGILLEVSAALLKMGPKAVRALVEALGDENVLMRERALHALANMVESRPREVALEIVGMVNGNFGDRLLEIHSSNERMVQGLHHLLLKCGEAMEHAA
ncbi:HEAT repeat domain-containing protein [Candidatus Micrarchaeota archaeon]|nr:HEAT repeat domain-containing protein [Candidatus Micrarchaeota archaeon]